MNNYHSFKICVISSWSYDMEGHAKKCVERCCELANRTTQQFCEQKTFTRHIFSHLHATISMSDIGSSVVVGAFHLMCHLHVACCLILYDSPFCFPPSLSSSFSILFFFIFIFHVGWFDEKSHAHFRQWGVRHYGREKTFSQAMSPTSSITTTSQWPLTYSSRSPPATASPSICMT